MVALNSFDRFCITQNDKIKYRIAALKHINDIRTQHFVDEITKED